jgi:hypothetical protein
MFTPIHLLPQNISEDRAKYRSRWETEAGRDLHDKIMEKIRAGAGEHFLQLDFEGGKLGFLEAEFDLKGIKVFQEQILFSEKSETFSGIDFSFAEFWHTSLTNACFFQTYMQFARLYNCTFEKCLFSFAHCYACRFEKVKFVNCDFIEHDTFTNCDFVECTFTNSFIPYNAFIDCAFDTQTAITSLPKTPVGVSTKTALENKALSDLYGGISDAYYARGSVTKARKYRFLQRQAARLYNTHTRQEKIAGFISEYLMGHGLRPLRVVACLAAFFLLAVGMFLTALAPRAAIILTCGALFTFGARTNLLNSLGWFYQCLYIFSSFVGICFTALFVTVLARIIREKLLSVENKIGKPLWNPVKSGRQ